MLLGTRGWRRVEAGGAWRKSASPFQSLYTQRPLASLDSATLLRATTIPPRPRTPIHPH